MKKLGKMKMNKTKFNIKNITEFSYNDLNVARIKLLDEIQIEKNQINIIKADTGIGKTYNVLNKCLSNNKKVIYVADNYSQLEDIKNSFNKYNSITIKGIMKYFKEKYSIYDLDTETKLKDLLDEGVENPIIFKEFGFQQKDKFVIEYYEQFDHEELDKIQLILVCKASFNKYNFRKFLKTTKKYNIIIDESYLNENTVDTIFVSPDIEEHSNTQFNEYLFYETYTHNKLIILIKLELNISKTTPKKLLESQLSILNITESENTKKLFKNLLNLIKFWKINITKFDVQPIDLGDLISKKIIEYIENGDKNIFINNFRKIQTDIETIININKYQECLSSFNNNKKQFELKVQNYNNLRFIYELSKKNSIFFLDASFDVDIFECIISKMIYSDKCLTNEVKAETSKYFQKKINLTIINLINKETIIICKTHNVNTESRFGLTSTFFNKKIIEYLIQYIFPIDIYLKGQVGIITKIKVIKKHRVHFEEYFDLRRIKNFPAKGFNDFENYSLLIILGNQIYNQNSYFEKLLNYENLNLLSENDIKLQYEKLRDKSINEELIQAIGRIRPFNGKNIIFILGRCPEKIKNKFTIYESETLQPELLLNIIYKLYEPNELEKNNPDYFYFYEYESRDKLILNFCIRHNLSIKRIIYNKYFKGTKDLNILSFYRKLGEEDKQRGKYFKIEKKVFFGLI
jgi:hypothetical protein